MEPPEARALLLKIAPRIGPEADPLAEACGRLPLALRLAASFLAVNEHIVPADYVRQLRDSRHRLQLLDKAQELTAEELGLEASFTLSFQQLPPEQQQHFTQLAVFTESFDRAAMTAVWGIEESAANDALDGLLQLSLLEWNRETQRFELHDLLREFARNQAKAQELDAAKGRHAEHFIRVADGAKRLFKQGGENIVAGLALFDRERGHLEAVFDWLESRTDKESAPLLVTLVNAVAYTSNLRFHPRQLIRWHEAQAKAARLAGHRQGECLALNNLGLACAALGDVRKAIEFYEQALVIARKICDRPGEGNALGNLGNACTALGDARKAIEFFDQALVIARDVGDRLGEGNALGNLGLAYAALGDVRKATEYYEQALVIDREIGNRRGEGQDLGNLGNASAALGDGHKAIEFYEKQLVIAREIGHQHGQGNALWNSALALEKLGDRAQAITRAAAALRILEAIEDPNAAQVRTALAEWRKAGTSS
jgi:tetratricopeptide (TPR) repeat protein